MDSTGHKMTVKIISILKIVDSVVLNPERICRILGEHIESAMSPEAIELPVTGPVRFHSV